MFEGFDDFIVDCLNTWNDDTSFKEQMLHAGLGLGEAGEVQNLIKKLYFRNKTDEEKLHIAHEISEEVIDVMYYCFIITRLLESKYNFSFQGMLEENSNKRHGRDEKGYYNPT